MNKENNGVVILNAAQNNKSYKTVIVFGAPRGGTSMVGGTLSKLGVFMGGSENLAPLYENTELVHWLQTGNKTKISQTVTQNNQAHSLWGVKILPQKLVRWWLYRNLFSDVVYVVVFRDILATAKRRTISMNGVLLKEMFKAAFINFYLLSFISCTKRPVFLVSYEKALLFPEGFVTELAAFLQLKDQAKIAEAVEFIKPSPDEYRIRSTTTNQLGIDSEYFGYLDSVSKDRIVGWGLSLANSDPVELELVINGCKQATITANLIREDVPQVNSQFHSNCGFLFNFDSQISLKSGDCIEVRIAEQGIHLINSPFYFS